MATTSNAAMREKTPFHVSIFLSHSTISVPDNIPLPCGLRDESSSKLKVPLRGEGFVGIALKRLNQQPSFMGKRQ